MERWLISDTHFDHAKILTFRDPDGMLIRGNDFLNVRQMNDAMRDNWQSVVRPGDRVYHLGDVSMKRSGLDCLKGLNGKKRLILGNHDILGAKRYLDAGFVELWGSYKLDEFLLTHIPVHDLAIPDWAKLNIHGHIHERPSYSIRHLNVSVERIDYQPISLDAIRSWWRIKAEMR